MKITKTKIVLKPENERAIYYTILKYKEKILLYSNRWVKNCDFGFFESKDGISFSNFNKIFDKSGVCHNFVPFIGKDGILYGIGGIESWKNDARWHHVKDAYELMDLNEKSFRKPFGHDPAKFNMIFFRGKIATKKILKHVDGLYLFKYDNGWSQVYDKPVVTVWSEGYNNAIFNWGKGSEFDGHISCVWDGQKYLLYVRDNVKQGIRNVQVSTSADLKTWTKFERIKIDGVNLDEDNYYSPNFFKYKNNILGIVAFFNNSFCSMRVLKSSDGINFKITDEINIEKCAKLKVKNKNTKMPVSNIIVNPDCIFLYIHENYLHLDKNKDTVISWNKILIKDFEEAIKC